LEIIWDFYLEFGCIPRRRGIGHEKEGSAGTRYWLWAYGGICLATALIFSPHLEAVEGNIISAWNPV